jgi:DNA-binding transcriptional LysR family regulator
MRNLNLDQLQTLVAIADLGTLAAAAQALHLAPPTVSLHVKELESRLGAGLLVRGRGRAELTPAGEALVAEGRKLLSASDDLVDLVRRRAAGREGVVRLGVSAGVSTHLLPAMLQALADQHAGVDVRIEAVGSADAMRRLRARTLDVGIVASPQPPVAELCLTPWRSDDMVALVPAAWDAPAHVTPDWLAARRWATFAPATQMHGLVAAWFGQAGHRPRPFLTLSYPGALKSLAAASQSAALLPREEVAELPRGQDVQVRPLSPPLTRPMAVAHRHAPPPVVASVLAVLAQFAQTTPTAPGG